MISKKILALVLALSVIVCALPMGSVFAANESLFPYTAETLTFTAEDFADGKLPVYMTAGFYIDFSKASDSFKAMATSKDDVKEKIYISGKVTFGNVVINITDIPAQGLASNNTFLNLHASTVAADDAELKAKMAAATDIANMEYDGDVIDTGATKACIRNFKRYVLHENNVTVGAEEDYLPEGKTWDDSPIYRRTLPATAAEITLTYKTARPTATAAFDAGTIFIPTAKIANAVPTAADSENGVHSWSLIQGVYQQHHETTTDSDTGEVTWTSGCCDVGQNDPLGIDGPYFVFKAKQSGTYNVYASRRDRYYKNANGDLDTDTRRDIYVNISGTDLSFASKDTLIKDNTLDYRLIAEDDGKLVTLIAGQEVVVRIMDGTGSWAGSYGLVLVPVGKTHDGLVGTVINDSDKKGHDFTAAYNYNVTARQIEEVEVNTEENASTATVTVNGVEVTAKTEGAYLANAVAFNNIKRYDVNGNYITEPTVLDALVAGDEADETYSIAKIDDSDKYEVKVNGALVEKLDQVVLKAGDSITCTAAKAADKTNFAPICIKQSKGNIIQNYGNSISSSDGLYLAGITEGAKLVCNNSTSEYAEWPIDIAAVDAFAGCHITGYVTITKNDNTMATTGDDKKVKLFIEWPIERSAVQETTKRLEFKFTKDNVIGAFLSNVSADLDGDGVDETYYRTIKNGKFSSWYDFSNLYLVNSSFDPNNLVVTATKVIDGTYKLTTTISVPVTLVRVTKDANGVITSIVKEHTLIDFMNEDGTTVTVGDNETVYVWKGTEIPAGTTMQPLCAPLTK